jgi:NTP pyrophosphatase (non-canonical NTP hydrolase)
MTNETGVLLEKEITRIFDLAITDPKPLYSMGLKLFEEGGELSEAINYSLGNLPHKTMKEPLAGEVADVINVALTILVKAYQKSSKEELFTMLLMQLNKKSDKWESVIQDGKLK